MRPRRSGMTLSSGDPAALSCPRALRTEPASSVYPGSRKASRLARSTHAIRLPRGRFSAYSKLTDSKLTGSKLTLLEPDEPPAYRLERPEGQSPFFLTCDHAGARVPRKLQSLGVSFEDMQRHI